MSKRTSQKKKIGVAVDELAVIIKESCGTILERLGDELEAVGMRFDIIEKRFDKVDKRLYRIGFNVSAYDRRMAVIEDHVRQLAVKVGRRHFKPN
jgi:hypothetical protein